MKQYQITIIDPSNRKLVAGQADSFKTALLGARLGFNNWNKLPWQIVRLSDGIILAQSKVAQS